MLKGQVFKEQIFENQIFAVFINTFLNGKNGIIQEYQNSMAVSAGTDTVTIQSGVVCIQGRFLEEDTETTLSTGTDTAYCSLVVEIDLDKVNTESEFTQGYYKIVKGASAYPTLTKNDIVNTNSGIYQYELARFRTSLNGISDFVDLRSYIDYDSLYEEIQKKLNEVEDGSIYVLKSQFEEVQKKVNNLYPVGSIYLSMSSTNPSTYFGGTWVQISQGRVLIGVSSNDSDFSSANMQGGKKEIQLTTSQLPKVSGRFGIPPSTVTNDENGNLVYLTSGVFSSASVTSGRAYTTTASASKTFNNLVDFNLGGNEAHSNIQPYLTCYIWQRTA